MANRLNIELTGKTVILNPTYFKAGVKNTDHPFLCLGGFGCSSQTIGRNIGGEFISDHEKVCISGDFDIMRLATEKEIDRVIKGE